MQLKHFFIKSGTLRILSVALAAFLVFGTVSIPQFDAKAAEAVNLAYGKTFTASTCLENTTFGLARINDGTLFGTGYTSHPSRTTSDYNEWVTVDLGSEQNVGSVVIYPRSENKSNLGGGFPVDFTVRVSTDNSTWATAATVVGYERPTVAEGQVFAFESVMSARYVKIDVTKLNTESISSVEYRFQTAEIEVYESNVREEIPVSTQPTNEELFFGGRLNYDAFPGLSKVKEAADSGDYDTAKSELLSYIKSRSSKKTFALKENKSLADLALDKFLVGPQSLKVIGNRLVVDKDKKYVESDITDYVKSALPDGEFAMFMVAQKRDGFTAEFASREDSEHAPAVVITDENGATYTAPAKKDTYVSAGSNSSVNFGAGSVLPVCEGEGTQLNPFDETTARPYMVFDLSSVPSDCKITSAKLRMYGSIKEAPENTTKEVYLLSFGDASWDETSFCWSNISGNLYSWDKIGYSWAKPSGSDAEYLNVICRFNALSPMLYEYSKDKVANRKYAEAAVEMMMDFISKRSGTYNRRFEIGSRLTEWVDCLNVLIDDGLLDGHQLFSIMDSMWEGMNGLSENFTDISNHKLIQTTGFIKAIIFFPELKGSGTVPTTEQTEWLPLTIERTVWLMNNLYYADNSFKESTMAYAFLCINSFLTIKEFAEMNSVELGDEFDKKLTLITKYCLDNIFPNGYDINLGDGGRKSEAAVFRKAGKLLDNDNFKWMGSVDADSRIGTMPDYGSTFYPNGRIASMRNGWEKDAVMANMQAFTANNHAHQDLLALTVYAYGSDLLVDKGDYTYTTSDPIRKALLSARAHNTVSIEGYDYANRGPLKQFDYWRSNDSADFAEGVIDAYANRDALLKRDVMFIKNGGFFFVSDVINSSMENQYNQGWQFMPNSNATVDPETKIARTDFEDASNVMIIPVDKDGVTSVIQDDSYAYYSAGYGLSQRAPYLQIQKTGTSTTINTVIFPVRANEQKDVKVNPIEIESLSDSMMASAAEISYDGKHGVYYVWHCEAEPTEHSFDEYSFSGKAVYIESDESAGGIESIDVIDGYSLCNSEKVLLESKRPVSNLNIKTNGTVLELSGDEKIVPTTDTSKAIKIYAPDAQSVTLNGVETELLKEGDYVYAVTSLQKSVFESNSVIKPAYAGNNKPFEFEKAYESIEAEFDINVNSAPSNICFAFASSEKAIASNNTNPYSAYSAIVRMNPSGKFDAHNGSAYPAEALGGVSYEEDKNYKIKMYIDVANEKFTATVTDENGNVTTVADETYAFRGKNVTYIDQCYITVSDSASTADISVNGFSLTTDGEKWNPYVTFVESTDSLTLKYNWGGVYIKTTSSDGGLFVKQISSNYSLIRYGYLTFDLSNVNINDVKSAVLNLKNYGTVNIDDTVVINEVSSYDASSWPTSGGKAKPATVTPAIGSFYVTKCTDSAGMKEYSADITDFIRNCISQGKKTVCLELALSTPDNTSGMYFYTENSTDTANRLVPNIRIEGYDTTFAENVSFTDSEKNPISEIKCGDSVFASANIHNSSESEMNGMMIVTLCDANGNLVKTVLKDFSISAMNGALVETTDALITDTESEGCTVSVYVWADGVKPLSKVLSAQVTSE